MTTQPGSEQTPPVTGTSGQQPVTPGLNTPSGSKPDVNKDKREKIASLRSEADEMEAALPPPPDTERLKVSDPHEAFSFGGTWVGREWTSVAKHLVPGIMQAARESGVTVTQEG